MKKIVFATVLLAFTAFADCTYQSNSTKVSWKAFKTYEKIGVGGSFDRVIVQPKSANTLEALLVGSTVKIDTASINSGNPGRDATLVASFFQFQHVDSIDATIVSIKESKAMVKITMNNRTTLTVPMTYKVEDSKVIAKGVIDLGDFGMLSSLSSINKACFDLHGGKTWQDVEIGFEIPIKSDCRL